MTLKRLLHSYTRQPLLRITLVYHPRWASFFPQMVHIVLAKNDYEIVTLPSAWGSDTLVANLDLNQQVSNVWLRKV